MIIIRFINKFNEVLLDTIDFCVSDSLFGTKDLKYESIKLVFVIIKINNFIARYRLNLKRHYAYENKLFVYACSKYGQSLRPHFHLLIRKQSR